MLDVCLEGGKGTLWAQMWQLHILLHQQDAAGNRRIGFFNKAADVWTGLDFSGLSLELKDG